MKWSCLRVVECALTTASVLEDKDAHQVDQEPSNGHHHKTLMLHLRGLKRALKRGGREREGEGRWEGEGGGGKGRDRRGGVQTYHIIRPPLKEAISPME